MMPDREKVIKGLMGLHGSKETMDIIYDTLVLLKEQEPVKPVIAGKGILEHTRCGACGSEIAKSYVFCWYCGRKVKWK